MLIQIFCTFLYALWNQFLNVSGTEDSAFLMSCQRSRNQFPIDLKVFSTFFLASENHFLNCSGTDDKADLISSHRSPNQLEISAHAFFAAFTASSNFSPIHFPSFSAAAEMSSQFAMIKAPTAITPIIASVTGPPKKETSEPRAPIIPPELVIHPTKLLINPIALLIRDVTLNAPKNVATAPAAI